MKNGRSMFAGILVFLLFSPLVANLSLAIRPEEPLPSSTNKTLTTQSTPLAPALPIKPTAKQTLVAEDLNKSGIEVIWDSKINSPFSVSGKDLEAATLPGSAQRKARLANASVPERAVTIMQNFASLYGIQNPANAIEPSGSEEKDELGFRHQRLIQTYQGIPVVGADLKVHFNEEGKAYQISGRAIPDINLDTNPTLTAEQAIAIAEKDFLAKGFSKPDVIKQPQLVIYSLKPPTTLTYQLSLSDSLDRIYQYWIDAQTGKIIDNFNRTCHIKASLGGYLLAGEGGGFKNFTGWYENYLYFMYDAEKFYIVKRFDGFTEIEDFAWKNQNNWSVTPKDRQESSVAFNMSLTTDYFKDRFSRSSIDSSGKIIVAYALSNWGVDAFYYDGFVAFGDGDGVTTNPLSTLDVVGHEVTHGVTDYTSGLIYSYESGALNESFSDIFGTNIEFVYQTDNRGAYPSKSNGTADWLIGEDSWKISTALRDMRNPSSLATVQPGYQQPKKYKGNYWWTSPGDNGGVHFNSGVQNFFYYLLCEGGSGDNEGIPYNLTGIGISNAETIAYRALTVYCTASTDFQAVRSAWISAARDLNSSWVPAVKAAWDAVDVGRITINSLPSASSITYGQSLSSSTLSGGSASSGGAAVPGSFIWSSPATTPIAGTSSQTIQFQANNSTYYRTVTTSVSVLVNKKALTGTFTALNKVYDGSMAATVASRAVTTKVGSDDVNLTGGTATFNNASVGTGKIVTLTGATLAGSAAANYTLSSVSTTTANITKATPTISAVPLASGITYGQTLASSTFSGGSASVSGKFSWTASSLLPTAGTSSQSVTFKPNDTGNYNTITTNVSVVVAQKALTGGFTASSKTYDGTTAATITGRSVTGKIGSDDVNHTGGTAAFDSASAGNNKTVTLTGATLTGSAAGNYTLISVATTKANITKKTLTGSFAVANKEYNGNSAATVTSRSVTGKIGSDNVNHSGGNATFNNSSAGSGKTVTLIGASLTGSASGNYTLGSVTPTTANITAKALTGTFSASNKVYDTTTAATVATRSVTGKVGNDNVNHTGGSATFDSASVGNRKIVTLTGATLTGAAAGNYTLGTIPTTIANISKATPTIATKPTATAITFGQALSNSVLSGGSASLGGSPIPGTFAWVISSTKPAKGTSQQNIRFTPTDNTNFNNATTNVSVTVVDSLPTASAFKTKARR